MFGDVGLTESVMNGQERFRVEKGTHDEFSTEAFATEVQRTSLQAGEDFDKIFEEAELSDSTDQCRAGARDNVSTHEILCDLICGCDCIFRHVSSTPFLHLKPLTDRVSISR